MDSPGDQRQPGGYRAWRDAGIGVHPCRVASVCGDDGRARCGSAGGQGRRPLSSGIAGEGGGAVLGLDKRSRGGSGGPKGPPFRTLTRGGDASAAGHAPLTPCQPLSRVVGHRTGHWSIDGCNASAGLTGPCRGMGTDHAGRGRMGRGGASPAPTITRPSLSCMEALPAQPRDLRNAQGLPICQASTGGVAVFASPRSHPPVRVAVSLIPPTSSFGRSGSPRASGRMCAWRRHGRASLRTSGSRRASASLSSG
jgi:hypothetical protein